MQTNVLRAAASSRFRNFRHARVSRAPNTRRRRSSRRHSCRRARRCLLSCRVCLIEQPWASRSRTQSRRVEAARSGPRMGRGAARRRISLVPAKPTGAPKSSRPPSISRPLAMSGRSAHGDRVVTLEASRTRDWCW